ncbi:MAG: hypothetical protein HY830_15990 [Actinobacteria bacterium]|nr:hypothetical protein [Actinomycetota bacterium]
MACSWQEENGLRYLFADYRGQTNEQDMATLAESIAIIEATGPGVRLLVQVDPNHKPTSEFLTAVKAASRGPLAANGVRAAFIGIDGIGRAVLRGLQLVGSGVGAPALPSKQRALEYLARH